MPSEAAADDAPLWLRPDWPAPPGIVALASTRRGGVSAAPLDSLNLGAGGVVADDPAALAENRRRFARELGAEPVWLEQVHGAAVVRLDAASARAGTAPPRADASVTREPGVGCAVLVADCLPVLMCSADGRAVGAAHAGWRGLAAGVLECCVQALCESASCDAAGLLAWLGPCIGPSHFEVGADVLEACGVAPEPRPHRHFAYQPRADGSARWRADLAGLARERLARLGLERISGGRWCTFDDRSRFFSFRRDGRTGRMAAAIAIRAA